MIDKRRPAEDLEGNRPTAFHRSSFGSTVTRAFRSRIAQSVLATILFLVIFFAVTKAWKLDIYSPLSYWGDALEMSAYMGRDYVFNDLRERLAAPYGVEHASSLRYGLNFLFQPNSTLFLLSYTIMRDVIPALSLYYLATFPLAFFSAYWVYGRLKLSDPFRFGSATLYALMPFHFQRNVNHLMESSYFLVPILAYIVILTFKARPYFHTYVEGAWRLTWRQGRDWVFLCVTVFLSSINEYHQLFFVMLLGIAALASCVRHRNPRILLGAIILLAGAGLSIGGKLIVNHLVAEPGLKLVEIGTPISAYGEAERYGLKMVQILLPLSEHPLPLFRAIRSTYDAAHEVNENSTVALGLFGAAGFLFLIFRGAFAIIRPAARVRILDISSLLNLLCVLIATIGGVASVAATVGVMLFGPEFILAQVRCYNRIIVFIAFFSYYAASVLVVRLVFRISPHLRGGRSKKVVAVIAWLPIFVFALWDQVPFKLTNSTTDAVRYSSDRNFFGRIEAGLPARSMLFQYPYNVHHMNLSNSGVPPYNYADGLRPYLNSKTLRFTYGGDAGSAQVKWLEETSALAPDPMIRRLCEYGFAGIIVHRKLFKDPESATAFEAQLEEVANVPPGESADRDFSFFSLREFCARNQIPPRNLDEERSRLLHRPTQISSAAQPSQVISTVRVVPGPTTAHLVGNFESDTVALVATKGEKGWLMYGPYVKLSPGGYQAVFSVTIQAVDRDVEVGFVDVSRITTKAQVAEVVARPLSSAPGEQQIALKFHTMPSDFSRYEFRVFVNGAEDRVSVGRVVVEKISD
jgi:phosphoglycerol transferase